MLPLGELVIVVTCLMVALNTIESPDSRCLVKLRRRRTDSPPTDVIVSDDTLWPAAKPDSIMALIVSLKTSRKFFLAVASAGSVTPGIETADTIGMVVVVVVIVYTT